MKERVNYNSPIYEDFYAVEAAGPFDLITIFETIEHLTDTELKNFLYQAN
jgi:2-polyprenyl-3-methyl-5-hydroxy-6-metoxy-1,4-benzoquinol methylase